MSRERHADIVAAARTLCDPHGVGVEYGRGGKHAYVILTHPDGRWHKEPIAWSPHSTGNQCDWMRQGVRRVLSGWGFGPAPSSPPSSQARRRAHIGGGWSRCAPDSPTRLSRDPWAVLTSIRDGCVEVGG